MLGATTNIYGISLIINGWALTAFWAARQISLVFLGTNATLRITPTRASGSRDRAVILAVGR